jgi:competence protein ComEA
VFGFTRKEQGLLIFLTVSFLAGTVVWLYRDRWIPLPVLDETLEAKRSVFTGDSLVSDSKAVSFRRISINGATADQLQTLPGIGPVMAGRIVEYRLTHGGFRSINDLLKIKGIGRKTLEKLKPYIEL